VIVPAVSSEEGSRIFLRAYTLCWKNYNMTYHHAGHSTVCE